MVGVSGTRVRTVWQGRVLIKRFVRVDLAAQPRHKARMHAVVSMTRPTYRRMPPANANVVAEATRTRDSVEVAVPGEALVLNSSCTHGL